jgi:hypothetical protein
LTPELVFGYEQGLLSPAELRAVHQHVQDCAACRDRLAQSIDITGLLYSASEEPPRQRNYLPYAAAAAILVASFTAWFWIQYRHKPAAIARIELPAFIQDLNPPRQTLMGAPATAPAAEMSPRGTAVIDARPTFRWSSRSGEGWIYKVQIFDAASDLVLESPEIQTTHWTPEQDLAPGVNYQWQVTAARADARLTLPGPPGTPPRFRVADSAQAARIRDLIARGASHSDLAAAYAEAGLLLEARHQVEAAIQDHPNDSNLRHLRDRLAKLEQR